MRRATQLVIRDRLTMAEGVRSLQRFGEGIEFDGGRFLRSDVLLHDWLPDCVLPCSHFLHKSGRQGSRPLTLAEFHCIEGVIVNEV